MSDSPTASSEWTATCSTKSSSVMHCRAIRIDVKTAIESWIDRSLTCNTGQAAARVVAQEHFAGRNDQIATNSSQTNGVNKRETSRDTHVDLREHVDESARVVGGTAERLEHAEPLGAQRRAARRQLRAQRRHLEAKQHCKVHTFERRKPNPFASSPNGRLVPKSTWSRCDTHSAPDQRQNIIRRCRRMTQSVSSTSKQRRHTSSSCQLV